MSFWPKDIEMPLVPLKYVCSIDPEILPESTNPERQLKYVDIGNVTLQDGITGYDAHTFREAPSRARKIVRPGDTIVSTVRTYLRAIAYIGRDAPDYIVSTGFAVIRPKASVDPRYLHRVLQSEPFIESVVAHSTGVSYPAIKSNNLGGLAIPLPDLRTQQRIADFLERETARIDELVRKKERLITQLEEKRIAVIDRIATRGLNDCVAFQPSNVEWVDKFPSQWRMVKIKRIAKIRYGIGEPPQYREHGVPLIRATNVQAGRIISDGIVYVDPGDIPSTRIVWLAPGDIIVVRSGAYTGDSALICDEHVPSIAGFDMVLTATHCEPKFLQYALLASYVKHGQIDLEKLRAAQPHLNAQELGSCRILLPPRDEQRAIVDSIEKQHAVLDAVLDKTRETIIKLRELRSTLINAAITGAIAANDDLLPL